MKARQQCHLEQAGARERDSLEALGCDLHACAQPCKLQVVMHQDMPGLDLHS